MKQFLIVAPACIAIIVFMVLHKYGGGLLIGIAVGSVYFLKAVTSGNGIGQVQIGHTFGPNRKPVDPAASIGMGLAAAGIASGAMGYDEMTVALGVYLPVVVCIGVAIAFGYALYGVKQERDRLKPKPEPDEPARNGASKSNGK